VSRSLRLLTAAVALCAAAARASAQDGPKVGDVAPDFTIAGATKSGVLSAPITLSALRGQTVVIAFFPKARTSGCTAQMTAYRDQYATLFNGGKGVTVLAISIDTPETLASWAKENAFPVTFGSDSSRTVGKQYGVSWNLLVTRLDKRVLFVVAPDGRIAHVMRPFKEMVGASYEELGRAVAKAAAAK
jgi:peroxiredoxin Q/BCP